MEDPAALPALEVRAVATDHPTRVATVTVTATGAPALAESIGPLLTTVSGGLLEGETVRADLRRIWALGVLADARVEVSLAPDGAHVTFVVAPHAAIDRVIAPASPELARLRALTGGAYEPPRIRRLAEAIQDRYAADGYADARISVVRARRPGVTLCVVADRGPYVTIGAIRFPGRAAVSDAELLAAIGGLRVGGIVDADQLEIAPLRVSTLYWNRGYARVQTSEARVVRRGARADIELPVVEGPVYTIGVVRVSGVPGATAAALTPGELFSRDRIATARDALQATLDAHASEVVIETTIDERAHRVDVTFEVTAP